MTAVNRNKPCILCHSERNEESVQDNRMFG